MKKETQSELYTGIRFFDEMGAALNDIKNGQEKILGELESLASINRNAKIAIDYLTEKEAGEILNKKSTWFFNMRKSGMLPYSKVGGKVFYDKRSIVALLEKGRRVF